MWYTNVNSEYTDFIEKMIAGCFDDMRRVSIASKKVSITAHGNPFALINSPHLSRQRFAHLNRRVGHPETIVRCRNIPPTSIGDHAAVIRPAETPPRKEKIPICTLVNDVRANQRKNKSSEVVLICKSFTAVWTC